ncbi:MULTISPECIES: glycosyltransferase family 2 protein [unclassified Rhizobium]|uniref:glycosyltransferase family 2 protein n=1 Tax=unclassified Rhizobium TaxID=2613769 RepID=UPI0013C50546|nr:MULTISPECIES: glycosyltransferase family 2 protein [unclassified Rhizobium]
MQKDEHLLLGHFAAYYGALVGRENIYIIDNGSSPETREILSRIGNDGCNIIYEYDRPEDFSSKGAIIGKIATDLAQKYDAFITLDCDEFIGVKVDPDRPVYSCTRDELLSEIAKFQPNTGYKILERLRNDVKASGRFFNLNAISPKLIFGSGRIENLCVGLHSCSIPERIASTNLVFFEFHNKPFRDLQRSAKEKLKTRVDINDRQKLAEYRGPGEHLPKYLLWSEDDYLSSFEDRDFFSTSAIDDALKEIGLDPLYAES